MLHALILSAALSGVFDKGEYQYNLGLGATVNSPSRVRGFAMAQWFPFPDRTWGGLRRMSFGAGAMATGGKGAANLGVQIWFNYGRPRPNLWLEFGAGFMLAAGFRQVGDEFRFQTLLPFEEVSGIKDFERFVPAPVASIRFGWNRWAMRVMGIITNRSEVVGRDYYAITLEHIWSPVF